MLQLTVNILGTLTVGLCAILLLRGYVRVRKRLLLWCGLCFAGLTLSNGLLIVDLFLISDDVSIYPQRLMVAAASMLLMLYGLIFESEQS
jgi:fluoride ion exporter CrcB/FEX